MPASAKQLQPGHDIVDTVAVELIGIGLLAVLAGFDDNLGTVLVIVMWGALLGWFLLHSAEFSSWIKKV